MIYRLTTHREGDGQTHDIIMQIADNQCAVLSAKNPCTHLQDVTYVTGL